MKGIKTIFGVLAAASLLFSTNAYAQENANRDENGKVVRGAYETNKWCDNLFIGIGAGWNAGIWTFFDAQKKGTGISNYPIDFQGLGGLAAEIYLGKWFTPSIGIRVGYKGLYNSEGKVQFNKESLQNYLHGDFMWNFLSTFDGYKETRVWNPALYVSMGVLSYRGFIWNGNNEFAAGAGLYNSFRITNRISAILDLSMLVTKQSQYDLNEQHNGRFFFPCSATVGIAFNLGKTNFNRHTSITPTVIPVPFTTDQYNALKDKVAALEKENAELKDKIAALEKELAPVRQLVNGQTYLYENGTFTAVDVKPGAPITLYFDCGSAQLSAREKAHLEYFTSNVLDGDTKLMVNGYADKQTGSARRNQQLSEQRVKTVVNLLTKAGAKEENIETAAHGAAVQLFDGSAKNRVVTVEVK